MRRITRLLKKVNHSNEEIPKVFYDHLRTIKLAPGEEIPDLVPQKSWIFVEEGFLLLRTRTSSQWLCGNVYFEGTSTIFYNVVTPEMEIEKLQVQAVEHSTVLYLTPEDEEELRSTYPQFSFARSILNRRSYSKYIQRTAILEVGIQNRISFVEKFFSVLFRAPTEDLAQMLEIKSKALKMALTSAQRKYHARKVNNNEVG